MLDDFPDQVSELLAFLGHQFPAGHPFAGIRVSTGDAGWAGRVDARIEYVELGGGGGVWAALFVRSFF